MPVNQSNLMPSTLVDSGIQLNSFSNNNITFAFSEKI